MQTVFETRRARLKELIGKYGTISALNAKLGWESTNPRLSQIQNRSVRSDRGTPYEMGDATAREIERSLELPEGWMDTPAGLEFPEPNLRALHQVAEQLQPYQVQQLIEIGQTLARTSPAAANNATQVVRKKASGTPAVTADTDSAVQSSGEGPKLVSTATSARGGHLDPTRRKPHNGAGHERKQAGRKPEQGDD